jgi:nucleotide-binding universal stress UspA family protein
VLGSVAEQVLRRSPIPMLLLRAHPLEEAQG